MIIISLQYRYIDTKSQKLKLHHYYTFLTVGDNLLSPGPYLQPRGLDRHLPFAGTFILLNLTPPLRGLRFTSMLGGLVFFGWGSTCSLSCRLFARLACRLARNMSDQLLSSLLRPRSVEVSPKSGSLGKNIRPADLLGDSVAEKRLPKRENTVLVSSVLVRSLST